MPDSGIKMNNPFPNQNVRFGPPDTRHTWGNCTNKCMAVARDTATVSSRPDVFQSDSWRPPCRRTNPCSCALHDTERMSPDTSSQNGPGRRTTGSHGTGRLHNHRLGNKIRGVVYSTVATVRFVPPCRARSRSFQTPEGPKSDSTPPKTPKSVRCSARTGRLKFGGQHILRSLQYSQIERV